LEIFEGHVRSPSFKNGVIIASGVFILYILLNILFSNKNFYAELNDLAMAFISFIAFLSIAYAAKVSKVYSQKIYVAWGLLAIAQFFWFVGDFSWFFIETFLKQVPFPSLADLFYLSYYPIFLLGIYFLPKRPLKRDERFNSALDIGIIMFSSILIFWNFLIGPMIDTNLSSPLLNQILTIYYPISDLILLFALSILSYRRLLNVNFEPLLLLMVGALIMVMSDSIFGYQSMLGTIQNGGVSDISYVIAMLVISLAGVLQVNILISNAREDSKIPEHSLELPMSYIPYIWMIIPFFLLIWGHFHGTYLSFTTIALGVILIILMTLTRQISTLKENNRLYRDLHKINKDLESKVYERTEELLNTNKNLQNEIAEREKIEDDLKIKVELLDTATDSIVLHDVIGKLLYANEKAAKMRGYSKEELMKLNVYDMNVPGESKFTGQYVDELMVKGEAIFESAQYHRDGTVIPIEVNAKMVTHNKDLLILSTARDITDRKENEAKLRCYREHLEDMVEERTKTLEKTNKMLQNEVDAHEKAEKEIMASLEEKEVLLREVHHRVNNNMQIISSLLNIQSNYTDDPETNHVLRDSRNRIRSMAMIHEKLYVSNKLSKIDFSGYVKSITSNLLQNPEVNPDLIKINVDVDDFSIGMETAVPLGLIINELVTNSIEHAFPQGKGDINLNLHKNGENFLLTVRDNGLGLPEGLDPKKVKTLGLTLVNSLVEQLNGSMEVEVECGTTFKIIFKELKYSKRAEIY
jgi:PAS domain S-box-containing protein